MAKLIVAINKMDDHSICPNGEFMPAEGSHLSLGFLSLGMRILITYCASDPPGVWSQERYEDVEKRLTPFLKQCGYNVKRDVQFLPISGLKGTNIK